LLHLHSILAALLVYSRSNCTLFPTSWCPLASLHPSVSLLLSFFISEQVWRSTQTAQTTSCPTVVPGSGSAPR
jgi:hypothetical protein